MKPNQCLNPKCTNQTTNPKYCSRSCAAQHTNILYPKKKTKKKCIVCNDSVKSYRHSRCEKHHLEYQEQKYQNRTVGEYRNMLSLKGKHPSWAHSHIRLFNRSWNKDLIQLPCAKCGYSKHVELCHIKDVASFSDDALLKDINSKENVIQLCRNCHWELNNNLISMSFNSEGFPEFEDVCILNVST